MFTCFTYDLIIFLDLLFISVSSERVLTLSHLENLGKLGPFIPILWIYTCKETWNKTLTTSWGYNTLQELNKRLGDFMFSSERVWRKTLKKARRRCLPPLLSSMRVHLNRSRSGFSKYLWHSNPPWLSSDLFSKWLWYLWPFSHVLYLSLWTVLSALEQLLLF